jgi:hypothetical protein
MEARQTTVQACHVNGGAQVQIDEANDSDFRSGDVFFREVNAVGNMVLRRAVRMTRLRREWNKYQRRINRYGH